MENLNFNYMANEDIIRTIIGKETEAVSEVDNSLARLARMDEEELCKIKGIGRKTAQKIMCAFELGKRLFEEKHQNICLSHSLDIYEHLRPKMAYQNKECAYVVLMGQDFNVIDTIKISVGGLTETAMDVREILRLALVNRASVIAIAHNHPSNNVTPSKNDDILTRQIFDACKTMRIFFMDHLIIGDDSFYSYHDKGKL